MNKQLVVKPEKCLGCGLCEKVCSFFKVGKFSPAHSGVTVMIYDEETFAVPLMCQQCDEAPCIKICPVNALARDEKGIVTYSDSKCIVCRLCADACPMGNVSYSVDTKKMTKCDRCENDPKCAVFCPTDAISFTSEDISLDRKKTVAETIKAVYSSDWKNEYMKLCGDNSSKG